MIENDIALVERPRQNTFTPKLLQCLASGGSETLALAFTHQDVCNMIGAQRVASRRGVATINPLQCPQPRFKHAVERAVQDAACLANCRISGQ